MIVITLNNLEVTLVNDSNNLGVTSGSNNLAVTLHEGHCRERRLGTRYIKSPLGSHTGQTDNKGRTHTGWIRTAFGIGLT